MIKLSNIIKYYGEGQNSFQALKGVDLEIEKGEFIALMGPSGSGKSTMANILGCLDIASSGKYMFGDVSVFGLNNNERALLRRFYIGFIFQGFNLLPRTTALENVELPLLYRGIKKEQRRKLALEALEMVGLREWESHTSNKLSGGQQQRVAIARAIASKPLFLLADEPTGNLDTKRSVEIMNILRWLNRDLGITILMVTHEPEMAEYADREVHFLDGNIDISKSSPLAANSPRTQSLAELEKGSINRPQVLSQSPFSTQPPNLTHDARILNSNLPHNHTANAGSLDSKIEAKNENLNSSLRGEAEAIHTKINSCEARKPLSIVGGGSESCEREGGERLRNLSPLPFSQSKISESGEAENQNNRNEVAERIKVNENESERKIDCHDSANAESRNDKKAESPKDSTKLESETDFIKDFTKLKNTADFSKDSAKNENLYFTQNLSDSAPSEIPNFTQNLKDSKKALQ